MTYFRQPADHGSWLYACDDGEQIVGRAPDRVPNYLFGEQPFAREYAEKYKIPLLSGIAGARIRVSGVRREAEDRDRCGRSCACCGPRRVLRDIAGAVDPEPHDGEIHVFPVSGNVYMLLGDGGNIVVRPAIRGHS